MRPTRVRRILASPSYRLAEQDHAFFERDEVLGLRLQTEYLKPELLLRNLGIRDTVVVYGSTRISEPVAAARNVKALRQALQANPSDRNVVRKLAIAERILAKSHYYEVAREFGRLVGSDRGEDRARSKLVIMTGGGPGLMEAANRVPSMSENPLGSTSTCRTSNIPIPILRRSSAFGFAILFCARCTCYCVRRR
jgi:hypothetical protein